ncbi:hypothetical protein ACFX5K_02785 [Rickettsiales bacterium LUAb2]
MNAKLNICNRALRLIKQTTVTSLEENSREAEECNFLYPIIKREIIDRYPWREARKITSLNSIYDNKIEYENYKFQFLLPFDCIKVLTVNGNYDFKRNGIYLYANTTLIKILYSFDINDELLSTMLTKVIVIKLAIELQHSLVGDLSLHLHLEDMYSKEIKYAMQIDSIDGSKNLRENANFDTNSWVNNR